MSARARLFLLALCLALATGCWSFTSAHLAVRWDPEAGRIHLTEELRDLRVDDDGACFDDAERCADWLAAELKEGNVLELDEAVEIVDERLRVRDGELDIVVRFEVPDDSAVARDLGFVREDQGRPGREKPTLVYTVDDTFPLLPVDPPRRLLHRVVHDDRPIDRWVIDPRAGEIQLRTPEDDEDVDAAPVLKAMPELEALLRERGLVGQST